MSVSCPRCKQSVEFEREECAKIADEFVRAALSPKVAGKLVPTSEVWTFGQMFAEAIARRIRQRTEAPAGLANTSTPTIETSTPPSDNH